MNFTREPIIETIITAKDGNRLVVRSSKSGNQEEYNVEAVEVVSFGQALFFRSLEKPTCFLVPVGDYEVIEVKENHKYKVYQRIFLSLQEDETELANPIFKSIYVDLINYFNTNDSFDLNHYLSQVPTELSQVVTTILMNEERESLHNWETKQIYVKDKQQSISQYVTETILTLRWFLVNKIIEELKSNIINESETDNSETLSLVVDYLGLTNVFSKRLGRVISRHN